MIYIDAWYVLGAARVLCTGASTVGVQAREPVSHKEDTIVLLPTAAIT